MSQSFARTGARWVDASAQARCSAIRTFYALAIGLTALHVAGCASPLVTAPPTAAAAIEASADDQRPQVPPGHTLREYVLCHESRVNLLYPSAAASTYTFSGTGVSAVAQDRRLTQVINDFKSHRALGGNADVSTDGDVLGHYRARTRLTIATRQTSSHVEGQRHA